MGFKRSRRGRYRTRKAPSRARKQKAGYTSSFENEQDEVAFLRAFLEIMPTLSKEQRIHRATQFFKAVPFLHYVLTNKRFVHTLYQKLVEFGLEPGVTPEFHTHRLAALAFVEQHLH